MFPDKKKNVRCDSEQEQTRNGRATHTQMEAIAFAQDPLSNLDEFASFKLVSLFKVTVLYHGPLQIAMVRHASSRIVNAVGIDSNLTRQKLLVAIAAGNERFNASLVAVLKLRTAWFRSKLRMFFDELGPFGRRQSMKRPFSNKVFQTNQDAVFVVQNSHHFAGLGGETAWFHRLAAFALLFTKPIHEQRVQNGTSSRIRMIDALNSRDPSRNLGVWIVFVRNEL